MGFVAVFRMRFEEGGNLEILSRKALNIISIDIIPHAREMISDTILNTRKLVLRALLYVFPIINIM